MCLKEEVTLNVFTLVHLTLHMFYSGVAAPMASYVPSPVIATPQMVSQQMAATPPLPSQELGAMYAPRAPLMTQPVPPVSTKWRSLTGFLSVRMFETC